MEDKIILDSMEIGCPYKIRDILCKKLEDILKTKRPVIFLCIGTDRSTGDSLGPLIGNKIKSIVKNNFILYGTLEYPVHAKNLTKVLKEINQKYKSPYIIAIDACLGNIQNIGSIIIEDKPLSPGAAMNKNLPKVGNISITGIVNISGSLEFMVLQNTRLYTVMHLADVISRGIYHTILKTIGTGNLSNFDIALNKINHKISAKS